MKNKLCLFILTLFFSFIPIGAQEKIILGGDTLVTITPKQLSTINGLIEHLEWTKKEAEVMRLTIRLDSTRIALKDSIIATQEIREKKKEEFYINQSTQLANENLKLSEENKKLRGRKIWAIAGGSGILGLILGILIML